MNKLYKAAIMSDLHVGAKNGSIQHNEDCLDFARWFCEQVKSDPSIDHIIDGGDFFDDRNKLSTITLDYGYKISKMIDDLGLPWFRLVGNHSLAFRNNRNIHNISSFESLKNSFIINEITPVDYLGDNGVVLAPYLFHDEYNQLFKYSEYPYLYIHGEFKGFVLTGETTVCEHGADHTNFKFFKRILSGHFHKASIKDNVIYVGNCFPLNYADANDTNRGMSTFEYKTNKFKFINWDNCPTYSYLKLSDVLNDINLMKKNKPSFRILIDTDIDMEEIIKLREIFIKKYNIRELTFEERKVESLDGDQSTDDDLLSESMDNIVKNKLKTISVNNIDTNTLIEIYDRL